VESDLDQEFHHTQAQSQSSLIVPLGVLLGSLSLVANFAIDNPVELFGILLPRRFFIVPVIFTLSALISELYGQSQIKAIVLCAAFCNVVMGFYFQWPVFVDPESQQFHFSLEAALRINWITPIVSSLTIILCQMTCVTLASFLKKFQIAQWYWIRTSLAIGMASLIDGYVYLLLISQKLPNVTYSINLVMDFTVVLTLYLGLLLPLSFLLIKKLQVNHENSHYQLINSKATAVNSEPANHSRRVILTTHESANNDFITERSE
jgi:uncharacterized integral membrane protein (TIGR00697 family)